VGPILTIPEPTQGYTAQTLSKALHSKVMQRTLLTVVFTTSMHALLPSNHPAHLCYNSAH